MRCDWASAPRQESGQRDELSDAQSQLSHGTRAHLVSDARAGQRPTHQAAHVALRVGSAWKSTLAGSGRAEACPKQGPNDGMMHADQRAEALLPAPFRRCRKAAELTLAHASSGQAYL